MIRLRTFGLTDLRAPDGSEVSPVLAQPKRFALLTYLAAARPRGVQRRDRLLALFWPELSEARARDALNQSLRFLRQALGAEALVRRSAEDVGVDPELVWCDASAFRAAAEAERWDDALALYRGDFLRGFFVEGADGFERWMETERAALRALAARGARELARRHEGEGALTVAITWGRRALEITPNDERALRDLLSLHVRAGDHAGALNLYEGFVQRLEEAWGSAPAPETQRLMEDLRSGRITEFAGPGGSDRVDPAAAASADTDWTEGDALFGEHYRIERALGAGGSATVYLARDLKHDRFVAVKVLAPEMTEGLARDRFLREIRIASQLQHPGIVPLFDSGEVNGRLYYVMPVVPGETLRRRLRRGPMEPAEVIQVLREVAESLRHAHELGVIHRDIKPENILLVGPRALVADFGIARAAEAARIPGEGDGVLLTQTGTSLGTPTYTSPEQAAGDPRVSHLADLYSLGVVGYELLTGRPPFISDTPQQILAEKLTREAPDLLELRPDAPPWLASLLMRCLEREPAQRPQSAEILAGELSAEHPLRQDSSPGVRSVARPWLRLMALTSRISPRAWKASALVAALLAAGLWAVAEAGGGGGDPNLVAVLPFRVAGGGPALEELSEGVVDLSAIYLTGDDGGLRAVEPATLFRTWNAHGGHASDPELDDDDAVAIARDLGAGWVLRGSFVGAGDDVLLRASLAPVGAGQVLHVSVTGPTDSLLAHVPRLLGRLLAQLDGIPPDQSGSLTTSSLTATRAYLVGQRHYRRGEYDLAVDRFTEALELDPSFALAGLGLLMAHEWSGNAAEATARLATETAWRNRQRLRAKDRALVEAIVGPNGPEPSALADVQAAREHAAVVAADRFEAWYLLADHLFHVGALLGIDRPLERADEAFRRSLALDPGQAGVLQHLIQIAARRGDTARVRSLWTEYRAAVPDPAVRFKDEWLVGQVLGDSALARGALEHFDGSDTAFTGLSSLVFSVALFPELIGPLRALLEHMDHVVQRREHREELAVMRRWLALDAGRPREADEQMPDVGPQATPSQTIVDELFWGGTPVAGSHEIARLGDGPDVCALGLMDARAGRWEAVDKAVTRLGDFTGSGMGTLPERQARVCGRILEAAHAQGTGRPEARRMILAVDTLLLTVPYLQLMWENLEVAKMLEGEGEYARAEAAAGRFRVGLGYPHYLAAYLREGGRMAVLAGHRDRAVSLYTQYLTLRADPEPAMAAEVAEVRSALDRLSAGSPTARIP